MTAETKSTLTRWKNKNQMSYLKANPMRGSFLSLMMLITPIDRPSEVSLMLMRPN